MPPSYYTLSQIPVSPCLNLHPLTAPGTSSSAPPTLSQAQSLYQNLLIKFPTCNTTHHHDNCLMLTIIPLLMTMYYYIVNCFWQLQCRYWLTDNLPIQSPPASTTPPLCPLLYLEWAQHSGCGMIAFFLRPAKPNNSPLIPWLRESTYEATRSSLPAAYRPGLVCWYSATQSQFLVACIHWEYQHSWQWEMPTSPFNHWEAAED
jgi:hypothetical protein